MSAGTLSKDVKDIAELKAQDIMRSASVTIAGDTNIYDAIEAMVKHNITGLPVLDKKGFLDGIISEKDVLRLLYDCETAEADMVSDYMTRNVVSFSGQAGIDEICECFLRNNFRRVAIVENGRLRGLISRRNIISACRDIYEQQHPELFGPKRKKFTAREVMKFGLVTVWEHSPIYEVISKIVEFKITGLPVVNTDMTLAGVISEKDVLRIACDLENRNGQVRDFMTSKVVTFGPDESLVDICDCLINNHFRRVIIVDEDNRLAGIISRRDIIAYILKRRQGHK